MIEWKDFQKHETLSLEGSGGGIFVRWGGPQTPSLFKVLFCPSKETPYSGGCFIFDVAIPDTYPEKPPFMRLLTTGGGNVRFNPNLYQCGKVCLSLLGTWSGEPWNPKVSNLTQLFMSILAMIFVDDPYFNEPGFQNTKGTAQGDVSSNAYNTNIRYYTLKHAVREMIESPPAEFATACTEHFKALWSCLREEYATWITREPSAERRGEMQAMVEESEKILFG
jgi:baculoviral IAP repeat-containing protein 6